MSETSFFQARDSEALPPPSGSLNGNFTGAWIGDAPEVPEGGGGVQSFWLVADAEVYLAVVFAKFPLRKITSSAALVA